jgi:hypothetical protein
VSSSGIAIHGLLCSWHFSSSIVQYFGYLRGAALPPGDATVRAARRLKNGALHEGIVACFYSNKCARQSKRRKAQKTAQELPGKFVKIYKCKNS